MSHYILLDTCILYTLVSDTEYSPALRRIEHLIRNNHVALLKPLVLQDEWQKHREIQKTKIEKAINTLKKHIKQKKTAGSLIADLEDDQLFDLKGILLSQITAIDDLLNKYSIPIDLTTEVNQIIKRQKDNKKAPFHIPGDHHNDAILFYSTIEYLRTKQVTHFFFVSNNTTQFAQSKTPPVQLHPHLIEYAGNISIQYTIQIGDTLKQFDELGLPGASQPDYKDLRKVTNVIEVDKTRPIVYQILEYLQKRFRNWAFIPKLHFIEHYPFITGEYFEYYHRPFTLVTDHPEVFQILKETYIEDGAIKEFPAICNGDDQTAATLKEIFDILHNNQIHRVAFKTDKEIDLRYVHSGKTQVSLLRACRNLDFGALLTALPAAPNIDDRLSTAENLNIAYAYYKVGNYKNAALLYGAIRKSTEKTKNAYYYIACFSIKRLSKILESTYYQDQTVRELIKEADFLDLDRARNDCIVATIENRPLIEYLHDIDFIKNEFADLYDHQSEIRTLLQNQSSGKTQCTENVLETYFSIEAFLSENSIVYDLFSEFKSIANLFAESLIMSYSSNANLLGRLRYFSDPILTQFIHHCKAEDLVRYIRLHKLKKAEYHHEANEDPLFDLANNLLTQRPTLAATYGQSLTADSPYFWDSYTSYIHRFLTIYSFWKFPSEQVAALSKNLLGLLDDPGDVFLRRISGGIHNFLSHNQDALPEEHIQQFFLTGLRRKHLHAEDYFETIADICRTRNIKIAFSNSDFQEFKVNFIDTCTLCNTHHSWHFAGDVYCTIRQQDLKDQIKALLSENLGTHFAEDNYYLATVYEIITPTEEDNQKYMAEIEKILDQGRRPRIGGLSSFYYDTRLDHFINFSLKFQDGVPAWFSEKASAICPYYDWLCKLDSFDYSKFDPQWLSHHFTLFYKLHFRKSIPLKNALLKLIQENIDRRFQYTFIKTYCSDE